MSVGELHGAVYHFQSIQIFGSTPSYQVDSAIASFAKIRHVVKIGKVNFEGAVDQVFGFAEIDSSISCSQSLIIECLQFVSSFTH